jgi:inner membrane protein
MDNLTHALAGALVARATAPRKAGPETLPLGRRMVVGAIAANLPDLDVLASYLSPLSYLYHHRGISHSLVLLPLWALLTAAVCALLWRDKRGWRAYFGVATWAIASHIVLDVITSFGTMVFAPFSDARVALSATFIIDLWFTGIVLAGLVASFVWRRSSAPAVAGLAVVTAYVGLQFALQQRAIAFGEDYARAQGLQHATVSALPRPVSPFNWSVIVTEETRYRYAHVNLIRRTPPPEPSSTSGFVEKLDAGYRPLRDAQWSVAERYGSRSDETALAREAFGQPGFRFFRWFAAYPMVRHVEATADTHCAWFQDLRFVNPGRSETPFLYGMCRDGAGAWLPFQLVGNDRKPVY